MNLFKGLLFLHGHITDPATLDEDFTQTYGNKVASERTWQERYAQPTFARDGQVDAACPAGGCG